MGCDGCQAIARREFLERAIAALGVTALAACGATLPTVPAITPFNIRVADYPALASVGGVAVVDNGVSDNHPIAVTRTGATTYVALSLICPHRAFTVELVSGSFYCPGHGATFAANGSWTGGQSTSNLGVYTSTFDAAAGTLQIG